MTQRVGTLFVNPQHGGMLFLLLGAGLVVGIGILLLMMTMPARYRKPTVMVVTFLAGAFYAAEFFWRGPGGGDNALSGYVQPLGEASMVVGSFTLLLGVINLVFIHGKSIRRTRPGWHNSLAFFVAMFAVLAAGLIPYFSQELRGKDNAFFSGMYDVLFTGMLAPLGATMFSLVAFYIVSASYRAFRIKSGEATLMMISAFIVMLGMVPVGVWLTSWLPETGPYAWLAVFRLENLTEWILTGPNAAAQRAITFGIAVGGLAMALRIWLSLERGSYFDNQ